MRLILYIIIVIIVIGTSIGYGSTDLLKEMPQQYILDDIELSIKGIGGFGGCHHSEILIKGSGEYSCNSIYLGKRKSCSGTLSKNEVLNLLKRLYDMQFFRLSEDYYDNYHTLVLEGDTIRAMHWDRVEDGQQHTVTLHIGSYEKRVIAINKYPPLLRKFISDVERIVWVEKCDK